MSKELAVVEKVVNTGKDVDALEELISHVPNIPTAELVTGFRMANTYSKRIEKFVNAVKKELVNNADQTGRFLEEGVEVDEKGHRYLRVLIMMNSRQRRECIPSSMQKRQRNCWRRRV